MKNSLQRAVALLVAAMMFIACLPVTALAEIVVTEASGGIQPFSIIDPTGTFVATYEFLNEDGTQHLAENQSVKNGETLYAPATPAKAGYKFLGWSADEGETYQAFGTITVTENATIRLKPVFAQVYYVFFMDDKGRVYHTEEGVAGTVIQADVTFEVGAEQSVNGWSTDAAGQNRVSSVTLANSNITLYPIIESGHWVTYNSNGGSYIEPVFYLASQGTTAPMEPTRPGYTFAGWKDAQGGSFTFGNTLTENITLIADWTPQTVNYTVIHWLENANDDEYTYYQSQTHSGTTGTLTNAQSQSISVTGKDIFGTEKTKTDVFTVQTIQQEEIRGDGSTIVNVYYKRKTYTLTFRVDSSLGDKLIEITAKYGANITNWPQYEYRKRGSVQIVQTGGNSNWKIRSGNARYLANLSTMPIDGGTLWTYEASGAQNTVPYYVEALDSNSVGSDGNKATSYEGRYYILHHNDETLGTASFTIGDEDCYPIEGYTFLKYVTQSGSGNRYGGSKFYYTRNQYTVHYYNGGSEVHSQNYLYEADITAAANYQPINPPEGKEGYHFVGWYMDPEGTVEYDFSGKRMPAEDIVVYAQWAPPTYTVTVYNDMAGQTQQWQKKYAVGAEIDESDLEEPSVPKNHVWIGWAERTANSDGTYTYTPFNFDTQVNRNIELYPYYISTQQFEVTYHPNGGTGSASDSKKYAQFSYADLAGSDGITAPEGMVFLCWNTAADGSGTDYYPNDKIQIITDVTLYAKYGPKPTGTQLVYHSNFGTNDVTHAIALSNNGAVTLEDFDAIAVFNALTNEGYEFVGWNTKTDGSGNTYLGGAKIIVDNTDQDTANHLYAQWKRKTGNITIVKELVGPVTKQNFSFEISVDSGVTSDEFAAWVNSGHSATVSVNVAEDEEGNKSGTITLTDLPAGKYKISESTVSGYVTTVRVGDGETVAASNVDQVSTGSTVTFTNTLKTVSLTVKKEVSGNMAYDQDEFTFTATMTLDEKAYPFEDVTGAGYTVTDGKATFTLKHGESVTLQRIPYGAVVKVTETDTGYTEHYQQGNITTDGNEATVGAITYDDASVTFINEKSATIDTGVHLDYLPYVLMLAVAGCAAAAVIVAASRRRKNDE